MGWGVLIALALLVGVNFISYQAVGVAMDKGTSRIEQMEIAAASTEQAQGIDQFNKALAKMNRAAQQNVAGAEESASASEELNRQAISMNEFVGDLMALTGG